MVSLIGPLVAPDWGALIKLIPIGVLALVAAFYGWVFFRYRRAGRRQIGMPPLPAAKPPAGIHLPGPSLAPFLISIAAAALFFSVAMGGAASRSLAPPWSWRWSPGVAKRCANMTRSALDTVTRCNCTTDPLSHQRVRHLAYIFLPHHSSPSW